MATLRPVIGLASWVLVGACYQPQPELHATFPTPTEVAGPPGGEIDPAWQEGYVDENAPPDGDGDGDVAIADDGGGELVGACTDEEIDATLTPYGEWIYIEGYGEVWRPYATVVGVDFTPYETCGTWVWTEWGWTFACEWEWGWLPFHYGRWGWFDDFWAWVPGYEWSPAWVEWRRGGGYVGWRPLAPSVRDHRSGKQGPIVRDHRTGKTGPVVRDHRDKRFGPTVRSLRRVAITKDWQWRFTAERDLGKPRIRAHLYKGLAEGLLVTKPVAKLALHGNVQPVAIASIMRPRRAHVARAMRDARPLSVHGRVGAGGMRVVPGRDHARYRGDRRAPIGRSIDRDARSVTTSVYQPSWQHPRPARTSFGAARSVGPVREHAPPRSGTPAAPDQSSAITTIRHRDVPTATLPRPPAPTHVPDRYTPRPPTYSPPPRTYSPSSYSPSTYSPPARSSSSSYSPSSYSPPSSSSSSSYSPPARSSSSSSYSPPSRSSSSSSYSPPARSYSPPASVSAPRSHRR